MYEQNWYYSLELGNATSVPRKCWALDLKEHGNLQVIFVASEGNFDAYHCEASGEASYLGTRATVFEAMKEAALFALAMGYVDRRAFEDTALVLSQDGDRWAILTYSDPDED